MSPPASSCSSSSSVGASSASGSLSEAAAELSREPATPAELFGDAAAAFRSYAGSDATPQSSLPAGLASGAAASPAAQAPASGVAWAVAARPALAARPRGRLAEGGCGHFCRTFAAAADTCAGASRAWLGLHRRHLQTCAVLAMCSHREIAQRRRCVANAALGLAESKGVRKPAQAALCPPRLSWPPLRLGSRAAAWPHPPSAGPTAPRAPPCRTSTAPAATDTELYHQRSALR
jgi:hypothetical protein